ncbi:MAG: GtrA family protein [Gammaproteobacteria bacterium]|nr:GtrA family protein [Gammaproteobacteria bacterium]
MRLATLYALVALIAMVANIGTQEVVIRAYHGPLQLVLSVVVGTAVGLVSKYVLDRRFIFGFRSRDNLHEARTFGLYTLMGLGTTIVFWSFEFGFQYAFQTKELRYLGAVIGLTIGYWVKYQLDKHFVFRASAT